MLELIIAFVVGAVGGGIGMFFIAKNNQAKFVKALNSDSKQIVDDLLVEINEEVNVKEFAEKIKAKFDKD